jgi:hypothetical protein
MPSVLQAPVIPQPISPPRMELCVICHMSYTLYVYIGYRLYRLQATGFFYALCAMRYALCAMRYALCGYALYAMRILRPPSATSSHQPPAPARHYSTSTASTSTRQSQSQVPICHLLLQLRQQHVMRHVRTAYAYGVARTSLVSGCCWLAAGWPVA